MEIVQPFSENIEPQVTPGGVPSNIQYNLDGTHFGAIPNSIGNGTDINGNPFDEFFGRDFNPLTTAGANPQGFGEGGHDCTTLNMGDSFEMRVYSYTVSEGVRIYSTTYLDYTQGTPYVMLAADALQIFGFDPDTNPIVTGYLLVFNINGAGFISAFDIGPYSGGGIQTDCSGWPYGDTVADPLLPNSVSADSWVNHYNGTDATLYGFETTGTIKAASLVIPGGIPVSAGGTGNTTFNTNSVIFYDGTELTSHPDITAGGGVLSADTYNLTGTIGVAIGQGPTNDSGVLTSITQPIFRWNSNDGISVRAGINSSSWAWPITVGVPFGNRAGIGSETQAAGVGGQAFNVYGGWALEGTANIAGGDMIINSGAGTGSAVATHIIFKSPRNSGVAVNQQTLTEDMRIGANLVTLAETTNIVFGTTTGTKIGTATTQKMAFYNSTPIVQPTGDVITALQNLGLVASATIAASTVSSGAALTKTDDTNVTLTLGGTPSTALLAATSITAGWTGTLSVARGGTGASTLTGAGIPTMTSADLTAQTAAVTSVTTVTAPNDSAMHTYQVGAYINVNSVSVDVIQVQVAYTDENSTAQTQTFSSIGSSPAISFSTIGDFNLSTFNIRAKFNTSITIKTVLTTGIGSINYDCGGSIMRIN